MAANVPKPTATLQICGVGPPKDTAEQSVPLSFADLPWVHFHPIQRLLFYSFPCSKTHFLETVVPNFKISLSQTLKHFFLLAGNLIVPLDLTIPEFLYVPGDSVSVTVSEANEASDFNYLTGNHPRNADEFYSFFSDLPEPKIDSEQRYKSVPLFTVQITLFPGTGICVGFNNHHVVGDASSIVSFIKVWSSISKLGGDKDCIFPAPVYDRSLFKDPSGLKDLFWGQMKGLKMEALQTRIPLKKSRATFILKKEEIQKLRDSIEAKIGALVHLSSFTIATAYVWTGLARSSPAADGDEPEYCVIAIDARPRLDPSLPAAYFGNCLSVAIVKTTHEKLKGDDGLVAAVEMIGDEIGKKIKKKGEVFRGAEDWGRQFGEMEGRRKFGVAGSPKFDLYEADFGWGKPGKYEALGIDDDGSMSLCKSREFEGGLEIGLSLPIENMDAFAAVFSYGLNF